MAKSHYLEKDRLANVIAAIQILGVSDQTTGSLDRWIAELEASEELTPEQLRTLPIKYAERKKWAAVFEQHPEFFKSYTLHGEQRVLLRWRYAQSFGDDAGDGPGANSAAANKSADADSGNEKGAINSRPLTGDQMQVLINTAIALHAKEAAAERKPERLSPLLMAGIGAALGTIVGGTAIVLLGWLHLIRVIRIFD